MSAVSVLILAGQREGVVDPLCEAAGVTRKALLPLNGRPMIDYVLEALELAGLKTPYNVSGFDANYDRRLVQSPSAPGPAGSALAALEDNISFPVIITTCDHPLLTPDMLASFLSQAEATGADVCVGLASRDIIQPAYPHVKRTYLNLKGASVSGCNLFYIANANGLEAIRFWKVAQHDRKRPWRLASRIGWGVLFRVLTGRLTLDGVFDFASSRLGITLRPVLLPFAEAAIDVDKPSDKTLVEDILHRRATT